MSRNKDNITEINKLMDESKTMGIQTLPPDINESRLNFSVNSRNDIRFGLGAIKGVGRAAVEALVKERDKNGPFKDCYNVVERLDLTSCNRRTLENLILAGAFDGFEVRREQYFEKNNKGEAFLEQLVSYGQTYQQDECNNSNTLFGNMEAFEITKPFIPAFQNAWTRLELLNKERELIGIYLSSHPLDSYVVVLKNLCNLHLDQFNDLSGLVGKDLVLGGIVIGVRTGITKKNKPFGIVKMEDYSGQGELALFGKDWSSFQNYFNEGNALYITGSVQTPPWDPSRFEFKIGGVEFLADVKEKDISKLTISAKVNDLDDMTCNDLLKCLQSHQGKSALFIKLYDESSQGVINLKASAINVDVCSEVIRFLDNCPELHYQIN